MGKISQVSSKYIVHSTIEIDGVVDRPDVIGAIFGQTEGLLGADLELRELQRSGRVGRIEVNVDTKGGKTAGSIIIPSSLDKAETAIIAASLEIIQRIGPCNAKIRVGKVEDVRVSKRRYVTDRAKELLKIMMDSTMPDSQELSDEVAYSVRVMEIQEHGRERLPAGPNIEDADEIILVEGRADVLNLLKHGFKNVVAIQGTSVPYSIKELCKKKEVTAFLDGDRGGDLILKELFAVTEIDFVCRAPDGKEVEELTKKEIHKALRGKIAVEQVKLDIGKTEPWKEQSPNNRFQRKRVVKEYEDNKEKRFEQRKETKRVSSEEKAKFNNLLEALIGTRGAYVVDEKMNILGKVPFSELNSTMTSLKEGMYAVIFDGTIDKTLVSAAEKAGVNHLIGMDSSVRGRQKVNILTAAEL